MKEVCMKSKINIDVTYRPSEDLVCREIEGELIIVPLVAGMGDMEDELFTLNETGRAIWAKLDGKKSLKAVAEELSAEYEAPPGEIKKDVIGLAEELLKRKMIVEVSKK
jgi:Coenzyme PQQ synthesis protein D (PqqD)